MEALKLMSEEMEQRSTAMAAEHAAMAALQQQHSAMLAQRAACGELEQQETLARNGAYGAASGWCRAAC